MLTRMYDKAEDPDAGVPQVRFVCGPLVNWWSCGDNKS
jgi:hypothetical protein